MKVSVRRILRSVTAVLLALTFFVGSFPKLPVAAAEGKEVDLLFIHDLHSNLDSFKAKQRGSGKEITVGGLARMKTAIDAYRKQKPETLLLDGGDAAMGTLYQTIYATDAVELRMMGRLGFDVTTFGNHDFDYGSAPLAQMFEAAVASGDPLPRMVVNNFDWTSENEGSQAIYKALQAYGIQDYVMMEKNGVRIAVTGVFGKDALACAPRCELTWLDPIQSTKKTVEKIKRDEDADIIICVSHSGVNEDPTRSEDELLAAAVPDLDVIISGHTHTVLEQPTVVGKTSILCCGNYGYYLGSGHFTQDASGRWHCDKYENIELNEGIPEDPEILSELEVFSEKVNRDYMRGYGYSTDEVIAENHIEFDTVDDLCYIHTEHNLGSFIADAYRYAVMQNDPSGAAVDVAVAPSGTIRDTFYHGKQTPTDAFRAFSLGSGADDSIGYPMVEFYLSGAELKTVAEVDATISDLMTDARLYLSGLSFEYNPHRMALNKVSDAWLTGTQVRTDEPVEIEDEKLYHVVTDLYSCLMVAQVTSLSYGLLSVVPKTADGSPLTDYNDGIVYNADGTELKAWVAIATYMESFERNAEGISQFPEYYALSHDRKIVTDSYSPRSLFRNTNRFFWGILGVIVLVLLLVALLIVGIVKLIRTMSRRGKKRKKTDGK